MFGDAEPIDSAYRATVRLPPSTFHTGNEATTCGPDAGGAPRSS
jgi:hypothetical protein